ncbi:hypothetical protein B0H14DRAFT_2604750 [Mycena olivaceomarginata]|nr:hypothetical protein B0H14DRAFT_2604750 [Mycena olivaceomarginata]
MSALVHGDPTVPPWVEFGGDVERNSIIGEFELAVSTEAVSNTIKHLLGSFHNEMTKQIRVYRSWCSVVNKGRVWRGCGKEPGGEACSTGVGFGRVVDRNTTSREVELAVSTETSSDDLERLWGSCLEWMTEKDPCRFLNKGRVWRGCGQEQHFCVWKEADRTKNMTAVDAYSDSAGTGLNVFSAERIKEKQRIQAEKRAEKKARRWKSDKPGRKMVHEEIEIPPGNLPNSSHILQDMEQELHDAEREASETLAGMWRLRSPEAQKESEDGHTSRRALSRRDAPDPFEDWRDSQLEDSGDRSSQSDEDEEQQMCIRTITEVAGHQTSDAIRHNRDLTPPACNTPIYSNRARKLSPSTPWSSPTPRPPVIDSRCIASIACWPVINKNGQARAEAEAPDTVAEPHPNL